MSAFRTEREPLALNGIRQGPADAPLIPAPLNSVLLADG